jgi:hypothetical protein
MDPGNKEACIYATRERKRYEGKACVIMHFCSFVGFPSTPYRKTFSPLDNDWNQATNQNYSTSRLTLAKCLENHSDIYKLPWPALQIHAPLREFPTPPNHLLPYWRGTPPVPNSCLAFFPDDSLHPPSLLIPWRQFATPTLLLPLWHHHIPALPPSLTAAPRSCTTAFLPWWLNRIPWHLLSLWQSHITASSNVGMFELVEICC